MSPHVTLLKVSECWISWDLFSLETILLHKAGPCKLNIFQNIAFIYFGFDYLNAKMRFVDSFRFWMFLAFAVREKGSKNELSIIMTQGSIVGKGIFVEFWYVLSYKVILSRRERNVSIDYHFLENESFTVEECNKYKFQGAPTNLLLKVRKYKLNLCIMQIFSTNSC